MVVHQEASDGLPGRNENPALLTTISEEARSPPLPVDSFLEKRLVRKILRLTEALGLPCPDSCGPVDKLLLATLDALKTAYPKCLSGVLGNHTSSVQQVVESQSLHEIGERVIEMLDQVTPNAKERFSAMENSGFADAAKGAASSEDLPERRTLPPVLCPPRSPPRHEHVHDLPSDAAKSDFARKDGQDCSPSTPSDDCVLKTTPSSVSTHPPSVPPPSSVPTICLSMPLQQLGEVKQDGNAVAATSSVPPSAQSHQAAPTANHQDSETEDEGARSVSAEAGQPTSSAPSMDPQEQQLVQGVEIPVQNAPQPKLGQEPPSSPIPAAKAPPPPPPGNISAVLRAKRAASKLKRSAQMGSLYRHLRDRVEGSGCHGGKRPQGKNKVKALPAGTKGQAGQGMADALAEMTKRSAYFRQIEEDAENHVTTILELKDAIGSFQSKDMAEIVKFHQHVEQQLVCLTDETQVLARFEGFPSKKLESLRMAAALYSKLDGAVSTLKGWKLAGPVSQQLDKVEGYFNKIKDDVDTIERNKDEEMKRFQSHGIHFDFSLLVRIKECMVDLSSSCMELALKECKEAAAESTRATSLSTVLWRVFQLAFRVYNFAGGQDDRADRLTGMVAHEIEAHPL